MGSWGSNYDVFMDMFAAGPPKGDEPGDRSIYIDPPDDTKNPVFLVTWPKIQ